MEELAADAIAPQLAPEDHHQPFLIFWTEIDLGIFFDISTEHCTVWQGKQR
jgi:hypothetical protein